MKDKEPTAVTASRTRLLIIQVDGKRREEVAGLHTALEVQHELRQTGRSVRVWEHYRSLA